MAERTASLAASDKGHVVNLKTDTTGDRVVMRLVGFRGGVIQVTINSVDAMLKGGDIPIKIERVS